MAIVLLRRIFQRRLISELLLLVLAGGFIFSNSVSLGLVRDGYVGWRHLVGPLIWCLCIGVAFTAMNRWAPSRDPLLFPILAFLIGWGIILQDRLAPGFFWRHLIWAGLGFTAMTMVAIAPKNLKALKNYRYTWLIGGLLLLLATFAFGVNPSGFGPQLWLPVPLIPNVYFQPSELLKLLVIVFLAAFFDARSGWLHIARHRNGLLETFPFLAPLFVMWGFCMLLLVMQQDLGAAVLFFVVFLSLLYLATGSRAYTFSGAALLLVSGTIAYYAFSLVRLRIDSWWNPWPEAADRAYQIVQSLYAISSGGFLGSGIYQGYPEYIPVVHSDFVFAAIGEEWGLVGTFAILFLFASLAYRGLRLSAIARQAFYKYLCAGIIMTFSVQALLIMGGVVKLLPLTGVTLPFVSYGGSSLLVSCAMAGLLIFVSSEVRESSPL